MIYLIVAAMTLAILMGLALVGFIGAAITTPDFGICLTDYALVAFLAIVFSGDVSLIYWLSTLIDART